MNFRHALTLFGDDWKSRTVSFILAALLVVNAVLISAEHYPEFDGAMNFQISKNLVDGNGYTTIYKGVHGNIQTGPTLILPAAAWFRIMGISKFSCQLTNLLYFVALMLAVLALARRILPTPPWYPLFTLLAVPELFKYGLFGYGEAIASLFTLLGLLTLGPALSRGKGPVTACGISFGLAAVTKTLSLISVGILFALIAPLSFVLFRAVGPRDLIRRWLLILALFLILPSIVEGVKIMQDGWGEYSAQVQQMGNSIGRRQGFGSIQEAGLAALVGRLGEGSDVLSQEYHLPAVMLYGLVAVVCTLAVILAFRTGDAVTRMVVLSSVLYFLLGFIWWHAFTGQQWWRRLYQFWLVFVPLAAYVFHRSVEGIRTMIARRKGFGEFEWVGLALVVVLIAYPIGINGALNVGTSLSNDLGDPDWVNAQVDTMVAAVSALPPEAPILVDYWWQAPIVALFSGRGSSIKDFREEEVVLAAYRAGKPVYFLLTYHQKKYEPDHYQALYAMFGEAAVVKTDDYALCKITPEKYCQLVSGLIPATGVCEFMAEEYSRPAWQAKTARWNTIVDFNTADCQEQLCTGWYPREHVETGSYRWMWRSATLLLPPAPGRKRLVVSVYPLLDLLPGKRQFLAVSVNGHRVLAQELTANREASNLSAVLDDSLVSLNRVTSVTLDVDATIPATGADSRELGLIVTRIGIE